MLKKLVVLSVVAMLVVSAQATPQFNVTFTGDAVGSAPNTSPATAGGVSTQPTLVKDEPDKNVSTLVQNTYTDSISGQVFGDGKVVVLSDNDASGYILQRYQGAVSDEASSGLHTISMDILIDSKAGSVGSFFIDAKNQGAGNVFAELFLEMDTGYIRDSGNGGAFGAVTKGQINHIDWVIDLDSARTEIYLNGAFNGYGGKIETSNFGLVDMMMSRPALGTLAIDNFMVQAGRNVVPEPVSILLLSCGALIGIYRKR